MIAEQLLGRISSCVYDSYFEWLNTKQRLYSSISRVFFYSWINEQMDQQLWIRVSCGNNRTKHNLMPALAPVASSSRLMKTCGTFGCRGANYRLCSWTRENVTLFHCFTLKWNCHYQTLWADTEQLAWLRTTLANLLTIIKSGSVHSMSLIGCMLVSRRLG